MIITTTTVIIQEAYAILYLTPIMTWIACFYLEFS